MHDISLSDANPLDEETQLSQFVYIYHYKTYQYVHYSMIYHMNLIIPSLALFCYYQI